MSINQVSGLAAYSRVLGGGTAAESSKAGDGGGFASLVGDMVGDAGKSLKAADQATAAQVAGKGDLVDVVTAVSAAELALDTVVSVRDRVVSAYQDIMRMQI
ncbi:flagellar hook-basal body complex protein FliE [Sphingomonas sp. KRR8]|uniref:flagellar hook-basal body complex protein FliE n=1 Tax=Sphingomonas sp. KRR8 TaxID=2942996 RepID=UPI00201FED3D|nr:flagellar hook-basal body complex protein FliE [Sphingomonas sp. KRR8]URD61910.1 flagellar hook-basal body complex protein FliE [Sphingomonas sp. KRR8]